MEISSLGLTVSEETGIIHKLTDILRLYRIDRGDFADEHHKLIFLIFDF